MHFHEPVLVQEVVRGLVVDPAGTYVDATSGGGGHSLSLIESLGPTGRLVALDRDEQAVEVTRRRLSDYEDRAEVVQGEFADVLDVLNSRGIQEVSGVLFDIGVSSHQLDNSERGFSYSQSGPIDMRMDSQRGISAMELITSSSEEELTGIIRQFGEEFQASRIARAIRRRFERDQLATTGDLRMAVEETRPRHPSKTLARVFQAMRIAVNDELRQLDRGLDAAIACLQEGGRTAVIAYHSLEDRLVKTKFAPLLRGCICPPDLPVCACGLQPSFRKAVPRTRASAMEIESNRRARSATLRIFEKLQV